MNQILAFSALCTITRHQNKGFWHNFTKDLSLLRIGCSYYSSNITVSTLSHMLFSPLGYLLSHQLIERLSINLLILELSTGRIGGLHKNEKTFVLLLAYIDKRLHAIRSQIRIDGCKILVKSCISLASYLYFSQMSHCISY